jgi:hypothetical protein
MAIDLYSNNVIEEERGPYLIKTASDLRFLEVRILPSQQQGIVYVAKEHRPARISAEAGPGPWGEVVLQRLPRWNWLPGARSEIENVGRRAGESQVGDDSLPGAQ